MKGIVHLATSLDGFIAKSDGDSDWVSPADELLFVARAREIGCVVVGSRTFRQYVNKIYPVEGADTIILSTESLTISHTGNIFVADSPDRAIGIAESRGHSRFLVAGGARTVSSFIDADRVAEIFLSVHPLVLGDGLRPFAAIKHAPRLDLIDSRNLGEGIVELHYRVV